MKRVLKLSLLAAVLLAGLAGLRTLLRRIR